MKDFAHNENSNNSWKLLNIERELFPWEILNHIAYNIVNILSNPPFSGLSGVWIMLGGDELAMANEEPLMDSQIVIENRESTGWGIYKMAVIL